MTLSDRDSFLRRVRRAVRQGNRPGDAAPYPARGGVGYQGAGPDSLACFRDALAAAGGVAHVVADEDDARAQVLALVEGKSARKLLLGGGPVLQRLGLADHLRSRGVEVVTPDGLTPDTCRAPFFAADLAVTGVDYLVAETGTVALLARPGDPRSLSLLPPVHVAVAERGQLLPDLFDLFGQLQQGCEPTDGDGLPSCVSLITGPSKTGDIELRLVTGVHGPGELHVVLIDTPPLARSASEGSPSLALRASGERLLCRGKA
jgi:L-lactate utilization protein LutC